MSNIKIHASTNHAPPAVAASNRVTNTQPTIVLTLLILLSTKAPLPCCVTVNLNDSLYCARARKAYRGAGISTYFLYSVAKTTH